MAEPRNPVIPPRAIPADDAGYLEKITQALIREHGSFKGWLQTMNHLDYAAREKQFCKQFKFMGPMFFFWSVGEEVPPYEEWRARQG